MGLNTPEWHLKLFDSLFLKGNGHLQLSDFLCLSTHLVCCSSISLVEWVHFSTEEYITLCILPTSCILFFSLYGLKDFPQLILNAWKCTYSIAIYMQIKVVLSHKLFDYISPYKYSI